jgi:hypothetical protein
VCPECRDPRYLTGSLDELERKEEYLAKKIGHDVMASFAACLDAKKVVTWFHMDINSIVRIFCHKKRLRLPRRMNHLRFV